MSLFNKELSVKGRINVKFTFSYFCYLGTKEGQKYQTINVFICDTERIQRYAVISTDAVMVIICTVMQYISGHYQLVWKLSLTSCLYFKYTSCEFPHFFGFVFFAPQFLCIITLALNFICCILEQNAFLLHVPPRDPYFY